MAPPVRDLADQLARRLFEADPATGSALGLREYDPLLPDLSTAAQAQLAVDLADIDSRAASLEPASADEHITRRVIRSACDRYRTQIDIGADEYTVSALPLAGPPALFALAARTALPDPRAARDYASRLRAAPAWIDATADRLRAGRSAGRPPVGSLVDEAVAWADRALATPLPAALIAPRPPDGWDEVGAWRADLERVIVDGVRPAIARWRELLIEFRPDCRPDDQVGLGGLPGGAELYQRCIAVHTTLDVTADQLHETGRAAITVLRERAVQLGESLDLHGLDEVGRAVRAAADASDPQQALVAAREAIARAEARAHEMMPPPLPDACAVEPMPATVADAGMAPHYTRPRRDTDRPGTFWFNTRRATAGTGWDLEAVAFHEAVPGHHSQLARLQQLNELPLLQQLSVTVHSEGWGLYAERLADEFGLYSGARAQLGAVYIEMHRAARLVVDTGLHDQGWSRARAVQFMVDNVALPEQFLADEVDRYIAWPGQALAYLTGQREILRLRERAQRDLGARFDLPGFHAALLDHGSLPMPVLADVVSGWVASRS